MILNCTERGLSAMLNSFCKKSRENCGKLNKIIKARRILPHRKIAIFQAV